MQRHASRHPLALVVAGVVLYATGPVFVQASALPGPVFSFWRLWLGVPLLGVAALLTWRANPVRPSRRAVAVTALAGLSFGIHQVLFMTAIKATSVTDVALMSTLGPVVVAFAAVPLFGERPRPGFRLWTALAVAGAAIVIVGASSGPQGDPGGMAMAAANVVFFAGFFLLSKVGRDDIDVLPFLFGVIAVAALAVSLYALSSGQPVAPVRPRDLGLAFAVAAAPGALGHFMTTWPLRWVAANIPPVVRLGQPLVSGGLAWWLLGEPVTTAHLVGGALTIAGVCGAVLSRSGRDLSRAARQAGFDAVEPAQPARGRHHLQPACTGSCSSYDSPEATTRGG